MELHVTHPTGPPRHKLMVMTEEQGYKRKSASLSQVLACITSPPSNMPTQSSWPESPWEAPKRWCVPEHGHRGGERYQDCSCRQQPVSQNPPEETLCEESSRINWGHPHNFSCSKSHRVNLTSEETLAQDVESASASATLHLIPGVYGDKWNSPQRRGAWRTLQSTRSSCIVCPTQLSCRGGAQPENPREPRAPLQAPGTQGLP